MTSSSSSSPDLVAIFPPTFPKDATRITLSQNPEKKAIERAMDIQKTLTRLYGEKMVHDLHFHPTYPFARIFPLREAWYMPKPLTHFFWYLTSFLTIAIEVHTVPLEASIRSFRYHPDSTGPYKSQMNLLSWFAPLSIWEQHLSQAWEKFKSPYRHLEETPAQAIDHCYSIFFLSLNCRKIEEDSPWDHLLTEYTQKIKKILDDINNPQVSAELSSSTTNKEGSQSIMCSQPIRFQSEGPSYEEEFKYSSFAENPFEFSQQPWEDAVNTSIEDQARLGIFDTPPEFTQSCKIRYDLTSPETHTVPPPELHTKPDTQQLWFTDEDWEDPEIREEVLRIIDEIETLDAAERRAKKEQERQTRRRHT
ncbi:hypothetical protein TIFTF001_040876 [Ficus carica]|uniref:Uncharacterized protein n=1 Tax=Ficus carica TaxID=3494 RepID=A0AA88CQ25_FICCA|nr:hypothetical protein TIFTF001_040863 [Ficus carica]GMN26545.1 hypothetical protein TIFTF001_040867 [Ficus carica]GMN26563.1 hypothetical protein TIFTF001_040872 [Ficus carica]GMN26599.1 hypothetical protein TIFTF001_040876 [Ficus carica]